MWWVRWLTGLRFVRCLRHGFSAGMEGCAGTSLLLKHDSGSSDEPATRPVDRARDKRGLSLGAVLL